MVAAVPAPGVTTAALGRLPYVPDPAWTRGGAGASAGDVAVAGWIRLRRDDELVTAAALARPVLGKRQGAGVPLKL